MRILFLNSSREWGGNEKWTLWAASSLAALDHTVYLGCRSDRFRQNGISGKLKFVKFTFANVFDIITLIKIRSFVKKRSIDIVIPTKQREYILGGLAAWKLAKIAARFGIDRPLHNFRNRFAFCTLFDAVIVNSRKIIETLSLTKGFDTCKCKLIYNGVAIPELSDNVRRKYRSELRLSDKDCCIICIGRLSSQKGIDLALQAFSSFYKEIPDSKLIIAGDGSEKSEYENLSVKLGIADKVAFLGHRNDVSGLLQAADLFWLSSRSEGMSNALLESMAHGKAVIAFDIAGVSEAIINNKNGIIVPAWDTVELTNASKELTFNIAKRDTLGINARNHVKDNFSKEKSVERLEQILLELIKSVKKQFKFRIQ